METLAGLLREYRAAAGMTQAGLAEKAGLSEQAISLLERGTRRRPRVDTIEAIGAALGLSADQVERLLLVAKAPREQGGVPVAPLTPEVVRVLPRQLPPTLSDFAGRAGEVAELVKVFQSAKPDKVQLAAVTGMGGVGKTALAVHVAHLVGDSFPDGQLYLDLRGYGPGTALSPADALSQLIRSLGLEDDRGVPSGISELAGLYRSRLAGQRVLILLDNANSASQVLPLLPGVPGSAVIATSRRALTTLPGFRHIALAPLSEEDSVELLATIAGHHRVSAEDAAARSIAELTGRLPLAVRLIGARLAARPSWPIEHMVRQLKDEHRRLDEFGTGESGVRANIAGTAEFLANSNQRLDRRAAAAIGLLGLPDGSDLSALTAAHLLDVSEDEAEQILERLVDLNLLSSGVPGRYRMHDLIRTYARERATQTLSEDARTDALTRVLQHYTAVAWRSQQLTHPESRRHALASPPVRPVPLLPDVPTATTFLDHERDNILALVQQASASADLRGLVPELAIALFGYVEVRSRWIEMRTIDRLGRDIAGELGYERLAAWLEHDLAIPDAEGGELEPALDHLRAALRMFQAIDDLPGQARSCTSLSYVLELMDRPDEALEWAEEALALSLRIGDQTVVGISHLALGRLHSRRGEYELARESFDLSLVLAKKSGNPRSLAKRLQIAGQAYMEAGHHLAATEMERKSFDVFGRLDDGNAQAECLQHLATSYLAMGQPTEAAEQAEAGLKLARAYGNQQREGLLLIELGRIRAATGEVAAATTAWRQAATALQDFPHDAAIAQELLAEQQHT
ncbi:helix-turn-helix domain-containing protein [Kribbella sp. NBC_00382]|uniref:ATP-binding protein n=1 Tax=Kribbella sp. NBC_00382 TaxID=2975967 RepID=UPI002E2497E1